MNPPRPTLPGALAMTLAPALVAAAVALLLLGRDVWSNPKLPWAMIAGVGAAALTALPMLGPLLRRMDTWRRRLGAASRRLAELEARGTDPEPADPASVVDSLALPDASKDERLDEALAELDAARRDEERLRERRVEVETAVREAIRESRARTEGTSDGVPGLDRLPALLDRLAEVVEEVRRASDGVLPGAVARDEMSGLLAKHARTGRESSVRAARGADDLSTRVGTIDKLVRRLAARTREIGQVLVVLNDITEQTSLLALNAGIIAAQAGNEGKGFAVVADEMRNLSERASSSTKETEILAQTLHDDVSRAVRAMEEASGDVRALREALGEAGDSTGLLADLGEQNSEAARSAVAGAERQAEGLRDLETTAARILDERDTLSRIEADVLRPTRRLLQESTDLLEGQWQSGAIRQSLRARLDNAVQAIRDRRGRDRQERRRLEERLDDLRESGRQWASDLEARRRHDQAVREAARDIRELAVPSSDG